MLIQFKIRAESRKRFLRKLDSNQSKLISLGFLIKGFKSYFLDRVFVKLSCEQKTIANMSMNLNPQYVDIGKFIVLN